jgi:predicted aconitase
MFHMVDVTPEPEHYVVRHEETIEFGEKELKAGYDALNSDVGVPDIVAIGCPHASIRGIGKIAEYLEGKKVKTKFWIFTSAAVKQIADRQGYTKAIEDAGARVFTDTCFVVAPVEEMGIKTLLTNSAKMAHYAPSWCGVRAGLAPLKEIVGRVT